MKKLAEFWDKYWTGVLFALTGYLSLCLRIYLPPFTESLRQIILVASVALFVIAIILGFELERERRDNLQQSKYLIALFVITMTLSMMWVIFSLFKLVGK